MEIRIPKIVLVGRPNVGKSTLFNRICGRRQAITDARPGSTRDRNYAQCAWQGAAFELVDTGGLLLGTDDPLLGPAAAQADRAIAEADRVIFVVDARAGLLPDDAQIAARLRREGRSVLLAVNKVEGDETLPRAEFSRLGFDRMHALSAEHGLGVGDLLDAALEGLARVDEPERGEAPLRVALVGRPNVGKSSLLNKLLGEERAVVSPVAGTTRDAIDSVLERDGKHYVFVDTAGLRRVRHLEQPVDHVSVVQARRSIDRADVAVLLLDVSAGIREMDATIGGYIQKAGTGVVIAANKWDVAREQKLKPKVFEQQVRDELKFLPYASVCRISARTGEGIQGLLKTIGQVAESCRTRVTTGQLNRVIAQATAAHAPKSASGDRAVTVLYATQVRVSPPTFLLQLNHPVELHFSYRRYLENKLRAAFGFQGAPIVLKVRTRAH